jgi:DNA-binding transcriptional regulator YdaS (Cro superfamily)
MNFNDLMRHFGTQRAAAEALGMKYQAVNNWVSRGYIPWRSQIKLERVTRGKLRAEPYPGGRKHAK